MALMTSKERLRAAIAHEEPDRVPVSPNMCMWAVDEYGDFGWRRQLELADEFDMDAIVSVHFPVPVYVYDPRCDGYDALKDVRVDVSVDDQDDMDVYTRRFHTPAGELTDRVAIPRPGGRYGLTPSHVHREHLVKDAADVEKVRFVLADPDGVPRPDWSDILEAVGDRGLLRVHPATGCGVTMMTRLMGMEHAMVSFYEDRALFDRVLALCAEHFQRVTRRMLECGVEYLFVTWHDLGVSAGWSPHIWREAFKPVIAKNVALVHEYGALYHYFDQGPIMPILPDLAGLGVDTYSSLCPPPLADGDLGEAKRLIGDSVCLIGNVDAIHVMQRGRPGDVRAAVAEAIRLAAPGGGFILGNSDSFFPGTPRGNVEAFFEAAREFGAYPIEPVLEGTAR